MKLASDAQIRRRLIRLAYANPELRKDILPLVNETKEAAFGFNWPDFDVAKRDMPAYLATLLRRIGPKLGKSLGSVYDLYEPTSAEAQRDWGKFISEAGNSKMMMTFGWLDRQKYTNTVSEWTAMVKNWAANKPPQPPARPGEVSPDPLYRYGEQDRKSLIKAVKAKLNQEFVHWINADYATYRQRKIVEDGIMANTDVLIERLKARIVKIAKQNKSKIFALPDEPKEREMSPQVANPMSNPRFAGQEKVGMSWNVGTFDQQVDSALDTIDGLLTKEVVGNLSMRGSTPDQLENAMNVTNNGQFSKEIKSFVMPTARAAVKAHFPWRGFYDCVTNKVDFTGSWWSATKNFLRLAEDKNAAEAEFRKSLIRLAHEKEHLRPHLLPLLQEHSK